MRSYRHWTPQYLIDRSIEKMYRLIHPDDPWLSPQANRFLKTYLASHMEGIEFGSGASTVFFARRIRSLVSVEHNPAWYQKVNAWLEENHLSNVEYHLYPRMEGEDPAGSNYVKAAGAVEIGSLDFALVDGIYRDNCAIKVLDKIKSRGILIIDNVNRYLPGKTRSPYSIHPGSAPATPLWSELADQLASWRCDWTSNGISDTAIYFKP